MNKKTIAALWALAALPLAGCALKPAMIVVAFAVGIVAMALLTLLVYMWEGQAIDEAEQRSDEEPDYFGELPDYWEMAKRYPKSETDESSK
jgi:hypothetical protein